MLKAIANPIKNVRTIGIIGTNIYCVTLSLITNACACMLAQTNDRFPILRGSSGERKDWGTDYMNNEYRHTEHYEMLNCCNLRNLPVLPMLNTAES